MLLSVAVLTVLADPENYRQFGSAKVIGPVEDFHQSRIFSSSQEHKNYDRESDDYSDDSNEASASSGTSNYMASYDSEGLHNNNDGLTDSKGLIREEGDHPSQIFENDYEHVDQTAHDYQAASARGGYGHKKSHKVKHKHKGKHK